MLRKKSFRINKLPTLLNARSICPSRRRFPSFPGVASPGLCAFSVLAFAGLLAAPMQAMADCVMNIGGTVSGSVYGNTSSPQNDCSVADMNADGATLRINHGTTISDQAYGGYHEPGSGDATATSNLLSIDDDSAVDGDAYGGYALSNDVTATASGNTIENDGSVRGDAYGGYAEADDNATASSNTIENNGHIDGHVYGGFATAGSNATASSNTVEINDSSVSGDVYGGRAHANNATASDNKVSFKDSAEIDVDFIRGGHALSIGGHAFASGNIVEFDNVDGIVGYAEVNGGYASGPEEAKADRNTVTFSNISSGATFELGDVMGGFAFHGAFSSTADGNSVSFTNIATTVSLKGNYQAGGAAAGGRFSASATGNSLTFTNVTAIESLNNLYGGHALATSSSGGNATADANYVAFNNVVGADLLDVIGGDASGNHGQVSASMNEVTFTDVVNLEAVNIAGGSASGGDAEKVSASMNEVAFTDIRNLEADAITGGSASSDGIYTEEVSASGNEVTFTDIGNLEVGGEITGGRAATSKDAINADNNTVTFLGIASAEIGGVKGGEADGADEASASDNKVSFNDSAAIVVDSGIWGGYANNPGGDAFANGNIVEFNDVGEIDVGSNGIKGGWARGVTSGEASADGNQVIFSSISSGALVDLRDVVGGYVVQGGEATADGNSVIFTHIETPVSLAGDYQAGGSVVDARLSASAAGNYLVFDSVREITSVQLYGGRAINQGTGDTTANANMVSFNNVGNADLRDVFGGYAKGDETVTASGNSVIFAVTNTIVTEILEALEVKGGFAEGGDETYADGNLVALQSYSSAEIGSITGGDARNGDESSASGNEISIMLVSDALVGGITGGYASGARSGTASDNEIYLMLVSEALVGGIIGGYASGSISGTASGNEIYLSDLSGKDDTGNATVGGIAGGNAANGGEIATANLNIIELYTVAGGDGRAGVDGSGGDGGDGGEGVGGYITGGIAGGDVATASGNSVSLTGVTGGRGGDGGDGAPGFNGGDGGNARVGVDGNVTGGDAEGTHEATANNNSVNLINVTGGRGGDGGDGFNGGDGGNGSAGVDGNITGGYVHSGAGDAIIAAGNTVTIQNVTGGAGGTGGQGNSNGADGAADKGITGNVTGGYAIGGSDSVTVGVDTGGSGRNNTVTITGTVADPVTVGGNITGSHAESTMASSIPRVTGGIVALTNVVVGDPGDKSNVYGGRVIVPLSSEGSVIGTGATSTVSVTLNNAEVHGNVYGGAAELVPSGFSLHLTVSGAVVTITNGGIVSGKVAGGALLSEGGDAAGSATNNTVNITGSSTSSLVIGSGNSGDGLYGGFYDGSNSLDVFTGNTLNVRSSGIGGASITNAGIEVKGNLANFEFLNFYLPSDIKPDDTMLNMTGTAFIDDTMVRVGVQGVSPSLAGGDRVILIDADDGEINGTPRNNTTDGTGMGLTLKYSFVLDVVDEMDGLNPRTRLVATVDGISANAQNKALAEGNLAPAILVNRGGDMVAWQGLDEAIRAAREQKTGRAVFGVIHGGDIKQKTDSHVDMSSVSLMTGITANMGNGDFGAFIEYGNGSYDTYNKFANDPTVKGDGKTDYYGGGILGRFDIDPADAGNLYVEGSARAGKVKNRYSTDDLGNYRARYKTSAGYASLHLGAGYRWKIAPSSDFSLYGQTFFTKVGSDRTKLYNRSTGEAVDVVSFKAVNSNRLRLGGRYEWTLDTVTPFFGLAYEYEFSGKAKASTENSGKIESPKMRGGTGIVEGGLIMKPRPNHPLSVNLGLQGYVGKMEGITGSLRLNYEF